MGKRRFYDFEVEVLNDKTKLGLSIPRYVMCEEGADPDVITAIAKRNGVHAVCGECGRVRLGIYVRSHGFLPKAEITVKINTQEHTREETKMTTMTKNEVKKTLENSLSTLRETILEGHDDFDSLIKHVYKSLDCTDGTRRADSLTPTEDEDIRGWKLRVSTAEGYIFGGSSWRRGELHEELVEMHEEIADARAEYEKNPDPEKTIDEIVDEIRENHPKLKTDYVCGDVDVIDMDPEDFSAERENPDPKNGLIFGDDPCGETHNAMIKGELTYGWDPASEDEWEDAVFAFPEVTINPKLARFLEEEEDLDINDIVDAIVDKTDENLDVADIENIEKSLSEKIGIDVNIIPDDERPYTNKKTIDWPEGDVKEGAGESACTAADMEIPTDWMTPRAYEKFSQCEIER